MKAEYALAPLPAFGLAADVDVPEKRGAAKRKPKRAEEAKDTRKIGTLQLDNLLARTSGEQDVSALRKRSDLEDTLDLTSFEDDTATAPQPNADSDGLEWLARSERTPKPGESTARKSDARPDKEGSGVIPLADNDVIYLRPLEEVPTLDRLGPSAEELGGDDGFEQDLQLFVDQLDAVEDNERSALSESGGDEVEEAASIAELVQDGYLLNITLAQPKIILLVALKGRPATQIAEICRSVKETEALRGTSMVALLSGEAARYEAEQKIADLADDFLVRPFSPAQLRGKIETLLGLEVDGADGQHVVVDLARDLAVRPSSATELLETIEELAVEQDAAGAPSDIAPRDEVVAAELQELKAGLLANKHRAAELELAIHRHERTLADLHNELADCQMDLTEASEKIERLSR